MYIYFTMLLSFLALGLVLKINIDTISFNQVVTNKTNYNNKILILLSSLQLLFLSVFRDLSVGKDTISYLNIYNNINNYHGQSFFDYNIEIGYKILNKILTIFNLDYRILIFLISIILFFVLGMFIYKESNIPALSFYLYVTLGHFYFGLSAYRQSLAIALVLFSIKFVREKRMKKFIFTIVLASLFHQSAIIFLIIYPISFIRINVEYLILVSSIAGVLYFFGDKLVNFMLSIYNREQNVVSGEGKGTFVILFGVLLMAILFVWLYDRNNTQIQLYIHIMIIAVLLQILAFEISIVSRVVNYFSIFMIILIPNVLKIVKPLKLKIIGFFGLLATTFLYFLYLSNLNIYGSLPYTFMW